jgi:hypothetical protein
VTVHASRLGGSGLRRSALLTHVSDAAEAGRAIAGGADLIDVTGLPGAAVAAIRAAVGQARLWTGSPAAVDADALVADALVADAVVADAVVADAVVPDAVVPDAAAADGVGTGAGVSPAAAVAAAAISTWLGAPVIRSRHVVAVRRAIDMTLSIAGDRLPALTTRGLA